MTNIAIHLWWSIVAVTIVELTVGNLCVQYLSLYNLSDNYVITSRPLPSSLLATTVVLFIRHEK